MPFVTALTLACLLASPQQQQTTPPPTTQTPPAQGTQTAPQAPTVRKVAIVPWAMKDGVEEARKVCTETVEHLFKGVNYEAQSSTLVKTAWEETLGHPKIEDTYDGNSALPDLPSAKDLLALGETLKVDLVCAGRAKWHTKSVWVSLGPKTKADCTVDIMIVDVANKEVVLEAHDVKADSTRSEAGLETAAALLVSFGFTAFSGGPKTPHQKRAGQMAVMLAMDPWLKTEAPRHRKIGG